jgi:enoyl-[acyl-carrier protein] reductase II
MKDISEMLGCRYPIIQGPLGGVTNPELVAAVSEAGGFGLLAAYITRDPDNLRAQIDKVKSLTGKPFGANLVAMNPHSIEFAEILADSGIQAVTTSAGNPKELIPFFKERGVKVLNVSPTVDSAKKAEALGADAIIAEGSESGGMQGFNGASTMVLVPLVVDAVNIPVVAAGGIADSRGYRASFALGAKGVQVGTCLIASKECIAHEIYKKTICEVGETSTRLVNLGRMQVRALRTPMVERVLEGAKQLSLSDFTQKNVEAAWVKGELDAFPITAGQIAGMIKEIKSVRQIIEGIVAE